MTLGPSFLFYQVSEIVHLPGVVLQTRVIYGSTWHPVGAPQPQECTHPLGTAIGNVRCGSSYNDHAARGEPWVGLIERIMNDLMQFDKKKNFKAYFRVCGGY